MTLYAAIFYLLGITIMATTALAITRRNLVHAVVYLTLSFLGTALLFYLLGAPLLAALEVIIYAGAIMVLFLFIIMMFSMEPSQETAKSHLRRWMPAIILASVALVAIAFFIISDPENLASLGMAVASPQEFGQFLFKNHWLAVEIVSFLLFVALAGALYLGRQESRGSEKKLEERA
jgi:NADH-quinone oxidoreductase subunit J